MNKKLLRLFSLILYRLSLDLSYPLISEYYEYSGMIISDSAMPPLYSWLIFLCSLPFAMALYHRDTFFCALTSMLYLLGFVPMTSLFMYMEPSSGLVLCFCLYWGVLACAAFAAVRWTPPLLESKKDHTGLLYFFILSLCAVVLYASWRFRGLSFHFDLSTVYELRQDAEIKNMGNLFNRTLSYANKLLPIATTFFLWKKQKIWFIGLLIVTLLDFGIGGHKTVFFSVILSVLVCLFYRNWMWKAIPIALALMNFAGMYLLRQFNSIELIGYSTRRVLFVPALLNYCYYDYFRSYGADYFLAGPVGKLTGLTSPHSDNIPHLIGEIYFNAPDMGANNGLFSDAYANLGIIGCVVMPIMLILCIYLLQYIGSTLPAKVLFSVVIVFSVTFVSSFLTTILFTHALVPCYLLLYLMSTSHNKELNRDTMLVSSSPSIEKPRILL